MTHHISENDLALYSTRDLDVTEFELVGGHLADCAQCRERLAEFERLQCAFDNLRVEPSSDDLRELRMRTIQAIRGGRRHRGIWRWASAAAAAIAVLLFFREDRETHPVPPRLAPTQHVHEPAFRAQAPVHPVRAAHRMHARPAAGLKSIALLTAAGHEPTIKITTSDPSVIILLPPDSSTDERTQTND